MINFLILIYIASTLTWVTHSDCDISTHFNRIINDKQEVATINICNKHDKSIIKHELWHQFYFLIDKKNREKWNNAFKICEKDECFVSNYAKTNEIEDFAETFQKTVDEIKYTNTSRKKIEFIEKLIYDMYLKINK